MARPREIFIDHDQILSGIATGLAARISELQDEIPSLPRARSGWAKVELSDCKKGWLRCDLAAIAGRSLSSYERQLVRKAIRDLERSGHLSVDGDGRIAAVKLSTKGKQRIDASQDADQ
jgi:hypothetical protein